MSMNRDQKCRYVETTLDFHFEGGFTKVIEENHFDEDEINKWVSMAYLLERCMEQGCVPPGSQKDAFLLLEDLYTSVAVDLSMGLGFGELDLDDVGAGYDIDTTRFGDLLPYALSLLKRQGLDLWRLLD